jgi:hypothetical protein
MNWTLKCALALPVSALAAVFAGCGMPGAPMPPSLNLPDTVQNLSAVRAGNQVSLAWTMPKKNTDKLLLKGNVQVHVCRREGTASFCLQVARLYLAPGSNGAFSETLPTALEAGEPRVLNYFVELNNSRGRSAGLSNSAPVLAGEVPAPVTGLKAEVRKDGVLLRWTALPSSTAVRLHRKLLTPAAAKPAHGPLAPPPEPSEQSLLVESDAHSGRALDKNISFGQTYEYRAQSVARVVVDGQTLELACALSASLRVEVLDVFPPAVPIGFAAVASVGENASDTAIDLSWQPDTESDLAGYIVYRREGESWLRISPAEPVVGPAFHDAHVQPGRTYIYAVAAIGLNGHASARSAEAQETVPTP